MTGIVTTLKTDHRCRLFGQQINNFAFTFITPLGTKHNNTFTH
jgi:hypothetical protein